MHLLFLALLHSATVQADACPEQANITALKAANEELAARLKLQEKDSAVQADASAVLLACANNVPTNIAARTFILLGVHHFMAGDPREADRFYRAAYALEGEGAWDDSLGGTDMGAWYREVGAPVANKGVVFAPSSLFPDGVHLVGAGGAPPWTMTVGTFTFQSGAQSVPVSVNQNALTVITRRYIEEFHALVDGVSESDLDPQPISTDQRRKQPIKPRDDAAGTAPVAVAPEGSPETTPAPGEPAPPEHTPPEPPADPYGYGYDEPLPQDKEAGFHVRPHLDAGLAWALATGSDTGASAPPSSFSGLGGQVGLGAALHLGKHFSLWPELGFKALAGSSQALRDDLHTAGYDGQSPIEEQANSQWWLFARLPVGPRFRQVSLAAGPMLAKGSALVTDELVCEDGQLSSCVATSRGVLSALGGTFLVAVHPRWFPLFPRLEVTVLGDGDRLHLASTLSVGWEGKP